MRVTIIVPCRNEERYIGRCLDSILSSAFPASDMEVLVMDGRSDDGTRSVVERYARRNPAIRLLDNPGRIVSTGLNRGIRAANGDIIVRMDAHTVYPPDYVPKLVAALRESGADNVGGRMVTLPAGNGPVQRAIAIVLAHPFGVGNAYFRLGTTAARWVDTVPFGCFRREIFSRVGTFDESLVRNQDDEFNHRLIRNGGRVLLLPDVVSYYYARDSLRKLGHMYYQYGLFKPMAAARVGRPMTMRQLVPSIFLLTLALLSVAGFFWPPARLLLVAVFGVYGLVVGIAALAAIAAHGVKCSLALALAFPVLHASYGWGFLRGLWQALGRGRHRPPDPAAVPLTR